MLKRLHQRSVLVVGLLLGLSSFTNLISPFIPSVHASTLYDGAYVTTDNLTMNTDYYSLNCGTADITTTWKSILLSDTDWSTAYVSTTDRDNAQASFEAALDHGAWTVTKQTNIDSGDPHRQRDVIEVTWTEDAPDASIEFADDGSGRYDTRVSGSGIWKLMIGAEKAWTPSGSGLCNPKVMSVYEDNSSQWISVPDTIHSGAIHRRENFLAANWTLTTPPDYDDNYEGLQIRGNQDNDGDGLSVGRELTQGTSDSLADTDSDGIDDLKESQWYSNRNDVFCKSDMSACAYPDPLKKDIYIEVDWMLDSNNRIYKPTSTQLSLVQDTYAAHDINAHFDTGQYGGGNQLPSYTSNLRMTVDSSGMDFYDYKNGTSTLAANFNSNRHHIWHYMVSGYEWNDGDPNNHTDEGSSGATYVSDDDTFISTGLIEDNPNNGYTYSSLDNAIAGTIIHELGHSLCLNSNLTYSIRSECYYQYVDSDSAPSTYNSVMNYSYQMSDLLDYSDGSNSSVGDDNDDWGAVRLGFADFANINRGDEVASGKGMFIRGVTLKQAKQLRNERRIFNHVDKTKRSVKRQMFDIKKTRTSMMYLGNR